jgi:hypothetical protein
MTLRSLFSDIEVIRNYNSALLQQILRRHAQWGPYQKIGTPVVLVACSLFLSRVCRTKRELTFVLWFSVATGDVFVRMNHFLKAYSNYCKHYKEALITLGTRPIRPPHVIRPKLLTRGRVARVVWFVL